VEGVSASSSGIGVEGSADGGTAGQFVTSSGGTVLSGLVGATQVFKVDSSGNLTISGTLTAAVKNFKIDDPLDPDHKSLYHASIESSEMMNLYSGNVTLGHKGKAVVELPEWFESLNGDFRYQLTAIGSSAHVYIAREIQNHQFTIAGGRPGMKVSWEVTGVRHDSWAQTHPMRVEQEKVASELVSGK
jgi:hypothetical protein